MLKNILIGLGVLVAVVLGAAAMQPSEFKVSRSILMDVAPETVFPHVNNFHNWEAWSPWAKLDPNATNSFAGPEAGKGASFTWSGNNEVGEGTMTITESAPPSLVGIHLDFRKPWEGSDDATFTFPSKGDAKNPRTEVTWTMMGHSNFVSKIFCLFMNMDKMVGDQFEKGLASMKALVESQKPAAAAPIAKKPKH